MNMNLYNNSSIQIADLGFGYGALLDYIQDQGFLGQYYGYDRNRRMIQYAKKNGIIIPKDKNGAPPFSGDENLLHPSNELKILEALSFNCCSNFSYS